MRQLAYTLKAYPIVFSAVLAIVLTVTIGSSLSAQAFGSAKSLLNEPANVGNVTSLCFGPDQRLYIINVDGRIVAMEIELNEFGQYEVVQSETILDVNQIQNHNDDGTIHETVRRQSTGILVVGTPQNPVIYATSSDYRVGGVFVDKNLDTNSGTISRLKWTGSEWDHVILVRGLPRSEENHATNGMYFEESTNTLYVAQGGNTNSGSPSGFLGDLTETALASAILAVDLDQIDMMAVKVDTSSGVSYVYDLPTVDDPTRPNANGINDPLAPGYDGVDIHDPFGGNDGLNQARLVAGGPVQIHSGGYRNPYDVVITQAGRMYTWDNGPNEGWGSYPINMGLGTATNEPNENGPLVINQDRFHLIAGKGYYGGHPNPTRGNPDSCGLYTTLPGGFFRTEYLPGNPNQSLPYDWPPVDTGLGNPREGLYIEPGSSADSSLYFHSESTNGLAEYIATNFDSTLYGDILAAGYSNKHVYRVNLNDQGTLDSPDSVTVLATIPSGVALDVTVMGDNGPWPGTVWVGAYNSSAGVRIFEPADFSACTGAYDNTIDEDLDGYTNADEIDNGSNPCNGADVPDDFDKSLINGFLVSNLNDPDDDDDGINDTLDRFVWDPLNGDVTIPREFALFVDDPGTGFYSLGFTGLMMNTTDDYLDLWLTEQESDIDIIAGGTAGLLTFAGVDTGDALGAFNDQRNAFHLGIQVDSTYEPFVIEYSLLGPIFPDTIEGFQSAGAFIGTGDQDNFVRLAVNANDSMPGIELVVEDNGTATSTQFEVDGVENELQVSLLFIVNPQNGFIRTQYRIGVEAPIDLGNGFFAQGALLEAIKTDQALSTGVIATARGSSNIFEVTWDHISMKYSPILTRGDWIVKNDGEPCNPAGTPGSCCEGRHEAGFVQSGDKFILMGGRENNSNVNIYDPVNDAWTIGATPPGGSMHHFQAVDYHGLVLVTGAMRGDLFSEEPIDSIYIYDPLNDEWYDGPAIPASRARAAAGVVIHEDTLYLLGGMTGSHFDDLANGWTDKFDIRTGSWSQLPDAPNRRDHYHGAYHDGKIYAPAGRRTGELGFFDATEMTVDVFDIVSQSWDTIDVPIPTERAGAATAVLGNEIIVIGGESGAQTDAHNEAEAFSTASGTWRSLDTLIFARHGTQAIVNNYGIYLASGATQRGGGGLTETIEAYYPYGETEPLLYPTIQSSLSAADTTDLDIAGVSDTSFACFNVYNTSGNQALLVQEFSVANGAYFSIDTAVTLPRILKPGDSLCVIVAFIPDSVGNFVDTITVAHSGANAPSTDYLLIGRGIQNWAGGARIYVDSSANGNNTGTSWADAMNSLAEALESSRFYEEIREVWVAKGTYKPGSARSSAFVMNDSLSVYGGFAGTENSLEARVPGNSTILSGDIGIAGDSSDNVYHVIVLPGEMRGGTLDGLRITGGNADGPATRDQRGAGVLNIGSEARITGVEIEHCVSVLPGSALHSEGENARLTMQQVSLRENSDPVLGNSNGSTIIWVGANTVSK